MATCGQQKTPAKQGLLSYGWLRGFEPPTPWTTTRCSNQLSYSHHVTPGVDAKTSIISKLGRAVNPVGGGRLDVEILDLQGVVFDEVSPAGDVLAHQ